VSVPVYFPLVTTGVNKFRPLRIYPDQPIPQGWDAYCVQTLLQDAGFDPGVADGFYGQHSRAAVFEYQSSRFSDPADRDGIAGILTQRLLLLNAARKWVRYYNLPSGGMNGHLEHECGFQTGVYPAQYPNETYDLGPTQHNLTDTYDHLLMAYNGPAALEWLAASPSHGLRPTHDKYRSWGVENQRAWQLAHGHWNRPDWADRLARGQLLTADQLAWINAYIASTTAYITTWPA
jgi:hypothetical protein